ncbi:calcium-binding protein [Cognatishimia sp. F0-27]|uniref:calcium-binding protein n=1 Tax=Cognatishimia sp. F0-27 TaxID=2816855 RepID=UPI001D0C9C41|nr:calcium-binding protein [Cognatishimia sp. F0-27]MCC1492986.1 hypothetical protein [Cognatishimia sp. F0-27]
MATITFVQSYSDPGQADYPATMNFFEQAPWARPNYFRDPGWQESWGTWAMERDRGGPDWTFTAPDALTDVTKYNIFDSGDGLRVSLLGDDFSGVPDPADERPLPQTGTLTGFELRELDDTLLVTVSGLSVDLATLNEPHPDPYQKFIQLVGGGNDRVLGSDESERGDGFAGNDNISMFGGNDLAFGGTGNDTVRGGDGADRVIGGVGNDLVAGERGNDKLFGGAGNDTIDGGDGNDMVLYTILHRTPYDRVYVSLEAGEARGDDGFDLLRNIEHAIGSQGDDLIYGTNQHGNFLAGEGGDDVIYGLSGNDSIYGHGEDYIGWPGSDDDRLFGGAGQDFLYGGRGNDTIEGGQGADTMIGGSGDDVFVFNALGHIGVTPVGRDNILKHPYSHSPVIGNDMIDLSGIDADPSTPEDDAFLYVGDAFTGEAGALIIRQLPPAPTNQVFTLIEIDADGDGIRDAQINTATWAVTVDDILL